jgi:hypothetical protein
MSLRSETDPGYRDQDQIKREQGRVLRGRERFEAVVWDLDLSRS